MREVPRIVWLLALGRFLGSLTSFLLLFLTLYLTGPRHLAGPVAGLLVGANGLGLLVGNFTGGHWGDRFGHRRVLLPCSTAAGLGVALVPWLPIGVVAVVLPVSAYLAATAGVSVGALTALAVERGARRTAVAIGRAASNAGFVLGPPLGAVLAAHSYAALFVVDGVMTVAVRLVLGPLLTHEPPTEPAEPAEQPKAARGPGVLTTLRRDRSLRVLLVGVVLADLVYRQLYTTVPLHLRAAGEPVRLYTVTIALGSALILLLEIPVALRLRRLPAVPVVATGYALVGLGFLGFGLRVSVASTLIAMTVLTAGEILYKTTATAHVLDAAPDHLVGQYQGLYTGAATSGMMLAGPLGTLVYAARPGLLWPLCFIVCLVAAAIALLSRGIRPVTSPTSA